MSDLKCPICECTQLQEICNLRAAYYLPDKETPIIINQYVCTDCGFVYQNVKGQHLQNIRTLYANTH